MNNGKVLIISGLSRMEKEFLLAGKFKCIEVDGSMADSTVEDILDGKAGGSYKAKLPMEKIVLINGYDESSLMNIVKLIRFGIGQEAILAAVTETSMKWSFRYLAEHLVREREWHMKNSRKH